ncbi:MAG: hypothetical protein BWY90_00457 [Deltaproteobacteria bacterium ADurb.BinA014]|jgi:hypothetical protein|nr:hypothetical protein [Sedimentibacter sp.]OPZ53836.1 MAG: hypothetical protein BWY90_00457 [Deltaproteobacteria bacterium ADurb.BinA014]
MRFLYILLSIIVISGCMPATTVRSVDSRPSIAIKGASSAAELLVDGLKMGKAQAYNGEPQTLILEPGTHKITIIENGVVIYEQKIFIESELKTITVK